MGTVVRPIALIALLVLFFSLAVSARNLDVNRDGRVDIIDATAVQNNIGSLETIYDVNNDGAVTTSDFDIVFRNIGLDCAVSPVACDADNDGALAADVCPDTPQAEINDIDKNPESDWYGCSSSERDTDGDGLRDNIDDCPDVYGVPENNGCPAGQSAGLLGEDLYIPSGEVVYSTQIKQRYNNIYIYGRLEVIDSLNLSADSQFILNGVINANGGPGKPGKPASLSAGYFEVDGIPTNILESVSCGAPAAETCTVGGETKIPTSVNVSRPPFSISGNKIVWIDTNYNVYLYDLTTSKETKLTTNGRTLHVSIYGNKVIWSTQNYVGRYEDIILYDLTTNKETNITTTGKNLDLNALIIYGDKIVWSEFDFRSEFGNIYMYDITTSKKTQITQDGIPRGKLSIFGDKIVLTSDRNNNMDIYLYDIATNKETRITTNERRQYEPSISGNRIVWTDERNGNKDVYMYDLTTNRETQITTDARSQYNASIYGNKIVWTDERNGNKDVYMYDLTTNGETQITTDTQDQDYPVIDGDKIVWLNAYKWNWGLYMMDLRCGAITKEDRSTGYAIYTKSGASLGFSSNPNSNEDFIILSLDPSAGLRWTLRWTNKAGLTYFTSLLHPPHIVEGYPINNTVNDYNNYFLVSKNGYSHILEYVSLT
ncbi:PD40 domain-containing protein, partial [Candidatus Woesearchaeota archaeon]|nr:PD40 domain-containing protein [Candidatus Woesearchaeota archaeon]